jgi:PIN domain nuclease of toxin-antitoxin system
MEPSRVEREVHAAIADASNEVYLSAVSSWEMAIKIAAGKLQLPKPLEEMVPEALLADRMQTLPLLHHHGFELAALPMHHRDPFDRMLIAQARRDGLTLVTADPMFRRYELELMMT